MPEDCLKDIVFDFARKGLSVLLKDPEFQRICSEYTEFGDQITKAAVSPSKVGGMK